MAEKGKAKAKRVIRGAGDDEKHVRTDIRRTDMGRYHLAYDPRFHEQARMLRDPFKTIVTGGSN